MGLGSIGAAALPDNVVLVCLQVLSRIHLSAGPANQNLVRLARGTQTEVQAKIALRDEAVTAADFALGLFCALLQRDGCPEDSGIRLHPDQTQADEVPDLRRVVIERGRLVHVIDQRFLVTVIEKIAERHAAGRVEFE
jgi:hypothetical protein